MYVEDEWFLDFAVHDTVLKAKIDTEAQTNVISCSELNITKCGYKTNQKKMLTAYSGHVLPVLGLSKVVGSCIPLIFTCWITKQHHRP